MTPPRFDAVAPWYQLLEAATFGPLLHRCRTALLPELAGARRALVVGDGDGRFLAALVKAHRDVVVDAVDVSPGMTRLARRRVAAVPGAAGRVRFAVADARTHPLPPAAYDLIITHFFLDCFPDDQLGPLVDRLAEACTPAGRWLVGDFREPERGWPRAAGRLALAGMYAFFRATTRIPAGRLADPDPHLARCGFRPAAGVTHLRGFLSARLWSRVTGCSARPG